MNINSKNNNSSQISLLLFSIYFFGFELTCLLYSMLLLSTNINKSSFVTLLNALVYYIFGTSYLLLSNLMVGIYVLIYNYNTIESGYNMILQIHELRKNMQKDLTKINEEDRYNPTVFIFIDILNIIKSYYYTMVNYIQKIKKKYILEFNKINDKYEKSALYDVVHNLIKICLISNEYVYNNIHHIFTKIENIEQVKKLQNEINKYGSFIKNEYLNYINMTPINDINNRYEDNLKLDNELNESTESTESNESNELNELKKMFGIQDETKMSGISIQNTDKDLDDNSIQSIGDQLKQMGNMLRQMKEFEKTIGTMNNMKFSEGKNEHIKIGKQI